MHARNLPCLLPQHYFLRQWLYFRVQGAKHVFKVLVIVSYFGLRRLTHQLLRISITFYHKFWEFLRNTSLRRLWSMLQVKRIEEIGRG